MKTYFCSWEHFENGQMINKGHLIKTFDRKTIAYADAATAASQMRRIITEELNIHRDNLVIINFYKVD